MPSVYISQSMCGIDLRENTKSFAAIDRFLCEVFAKPFAVDLISYKCEYQQTVILFRL